MNATTYPGRLFDGRVAVAHPVSVAVRTDRVKLTRDDGAVLEWTFAAIGVESEAGGTVVVQGEERLIVGDAAFRQDLKDAAPALFPKPTLRFALMGVPLIVLGALWFGWGWLADAIVDLIPPERERAMTRSLVDDIKPCAAAYQLGTPLWTMTTRMTDHLRYPMAPEIWIVPGDMVNAVTLPGGRILIFEGLVRRVRTPDQVAAVLAHELAHFEARDPLHQMLSGAGLSVLAQVLSGNTTSGSVGQFLMLTHHSREAERAADDRAIDILKSAGMPSNGLSQFLEEFTADQQSPEIAVYLQTHPRTAERVARVRQREQADGQPALNDKQWEDLRNACSSTPQKLPEVIQFIKRLTGSQAVGVDVLQGELHR